MSYAQQASWTALKNPPPGGSVINMLLLSDGTVLTQSGDDGQHWFKLTPDAQGSYVNGTWTTTAPMSFPRLYFATNILQDGRVWLLGGEYTGPYFDPNIAPSGEIYDPVKDTWSPIAPYPTEAGARFCGTRNVTSDVQLAAGSPTVTGIYSTDRLTPGWTITGNGIPAGATVLSVDSATQVTISANATLTGPSPAVRFRGIALACFGDDPSILLSGHRILAGNIFNNSTYIYSVDTNSWTQAATKVYNDRSDEEGWASMGGGGVLTYDLFQSVTNNQGYAELYDPIQNVWTPISPADGSANGTLPVLTSPALGFELGPVLRLQDGRAIVIGANQHTGLYKPANNSWSAGPDIHGTLSNPFGAVRGANFGADDAPAALMPNGHVLLAADAGPNPINQNGDAAAGSDIISNIPSTAGLQVTWAVAQADGTRNVIPPGTIITSIDSRHQIHLSSKATVSAQQISLVFGGEFSSPTQLFDFDPDENNISPVSPPLNDPNLPTFAAFVTRMLVLPTGQVLFSDGLGNQLYAYTPQGAARPNYRPVIERVTHNDGVFTLTGRQLNGPSDASAYGDDAQSNENFPIIRLQNSSGLVFYCRSTNWTSTSVGNIPHESVNFTLNPAVTPDVYQLIVSAGGISSAPFTIRISNDDLDHH
ncbi:MAG: hypothetical protein DMG99_03615 [Acidobacteria bacterium]|nr:MAG: hypothetical protein DMG99_03615 [Acidobacteriota bacterium]